MRSIKIALAFSFAVPAIAAAQGSRTAGPSSELKTWQTPWDKTRPRDPYADQQGRVWFVGQVGNYVAPGTPVMSVVSSRETWIEANYKETAGEKAADDSRLPSRARWSAGAKL